MITTVIQINVYISSHGYFLHFGHMYVKIT
jgi:hypothetical protein